MTHPIYTCLWFDNQAHEAAEFYCSIFDDSTILDENPAVTTFKINDYKIMALNGGPKFTFNEAISLVVNCDTQAEIDFLWDKLTADGGQEGNCGWLKDRFGVSWQVVPSILPELLSNPQKANSVMQAFMTMKKFDIEALKSA